MALSISKMEGSEECIKTNAAPCSLLPAACCRSPANLTSHAWEEYNYEVKSVSRGPSI